MTDVDRLLKPCSAILLDMCGTFMFGHDRFGPHEDYGRTYKVLGGTSLSDDAIRTSITACLVSMNRA
jgi:putative hydrolase of the HAD superfamily